MEDLLKEFPVTIIRKKGLLEILPTGLHKGLVTRQILVGDVIRRGGHPDFVLCIGDDTTDENMFKTIYEYIAERSEDSIHGAQQERKPKVLVQQHVFTCTVAKKASNAHLYLNEVSDVENLLHELAFGEHSTMQQEDVPPTSP